MATTITHLATLRTEGGDWTVLHVRRPAFRGPALLLFVLGSLRAPVRRHVVIVDARVYGVLSAGSMACVEQGLRTVLQQYEHRNATPTRNSRNVRMTRDPSMTHDLSGT